jgi:hypothetical protein
MRILFTFLLSSCVLFFSCNKEKAGPRIAFNTANGFVTGNIVAAPGSSFAVGLICDKTSDDLSMLYTEYAYDNANTGTIHRRYYAGPDEREHFEQNITITTRSQTGNERWIFNMTDSDGRISKLEIRVTVQ